MLGYYFPMEGRFHHMGGHEGHEKIITFTSGRILVAITYLSTARLCMVGTFCNKEKESDHFKDQVQVLDDNPQVWDQGPT